MNDLVKIIENVKYIDFKPFYFFVTCKVLDTIELRKISKENILKIKDKTKKNEVSIYVNKNGIIEWLTHRVYLKNKTKIVKDLIELGFLRRNDFIFNTSKATTFGDDLEIILKSLGITLEREKFFNKYIVDFFIENENIAIEYNEKNHQSYNKEKEKERYKYLSDIFKKIIIIDDSKSNIENIAIILKEIFKK